MDYSSFSQENFDLKSWINTALQQGRTGQPDDTVEVFTK
jgi:hypothetical protein